MRSTRDMAGPPAQNFHSSAATSAIPEKAEQVQITCMWCKCLERHLHGMVVCQIKE